MAQKSAPKPVNLTQTSAFLRNAIKVGIIAIFVLMIGRIFITSLIDYIKSLNPPTPPPPTVGFHQLPAIVFPESSYSVESYTLETVGQQLPTFGDRAQVFFMPAAEPNLFASDRAVKKANSLGYSGSYQTIDKRTFRWTNSSPLLSTLEMDILTGTFTITTDWSVHPELLSEDKQLNVNSLTSQLKSTLSQASSLSKDLLKGPTKIVYLTSLGGQFEEVSSISEADFVEIHLYRDLIDEKYGAVSASGNNGPIRAVVTSSGTIIDMEMNALMVEYEEVETYPLQSPTAAWETLKSGGGYIANMKNQTNAVIRKVSLAYYEPDKEIPYYRPVYVFEGDDEFIAYVDAIDPIWILSDTISP